ncbi:hypothetical protein D3C76_1296290 [compost metagenome]
MEGHVADQQVLAQRVGAGCQQFVADFLADDRHGSATSFVGFAEKAALHDRPVEDGGEFDVVAANVEPLVVVAVAHHQVAADDRHDAPNLGQFGDGGDVIEGDDAAWLAQRRRAAVEVEDVGTERGHLSHDLAFAAFAHGQHDHDRSHANDDAKQCQGSAEPVDPHDPPRCL